MITLVLVLFGIAGLVLFAAVLRVRHVQRCPECQQREQDS